MIDPFVGTWTLNPTRSAFDPNHQPAQATMRWELDAEGTYALFAAGVDAKGAPCEKNPSACVRTVWHTPSRAFPG